MIPVKGMQKEEREWSKKADKEDVTGLVALGIRLPKAISIDEDRFPTRCQGQMKTHRRAMKLRNLS